MSDLHPITAPSTVQTTTLSPPLDFKATLHHASEILADPELAARLTSFVNITYKYFPPSILTRWDMSEDRLEDPSSIHSLLGPTGLFAVVYNPQGEGEPLACASTSAWHGDLEGHILESESGWEIKTVGVRQGWRKRGLAELCIEGLTGHLLGVEGGRVTLWVHMVEDLNGVYWRKKGFMDVRGYDKPAGIWGSYFGYRLTVLTKVVEGEKGNEGLERVDSGVVN
ncbi:hypothetical protein P154DRAFT_559460 [Amniculicola lignicola CBS 123094]|uniref:N-acetyltransferase domain-containing protein n=1 Tax=Amniculicola lignicola CBS 123094 TaxID=1392246 RepID=A0A6A5X227_9PLEO|nr:hypothetical protein P154DRAFT_559460 [Amniculicola lignicola CBS 123094]